MKNTFTSSMAVLILGLATVSTAGAAETNQTGDFSRGAQAWVANCTRCHNARDPKEFRDDLWKPIVTHMRIRAGLTGQEARDILTFLTESN